MKVNFNSKLQLFISGFFLLVASSCYYDGNHFNNCINGNGEQVSQTRSVADFDRINNKIGIDVFITQGSETSVRIDAYENILGRISTDVINGELTISSINCFSNGNVDIHITTPDISEITSTGSGQITGTNAWNVEDLELTITGSGEIDAEITATELECNITGSGEIKLDGACEEMDIDITGSGNFEGFGLVSDEADITVSGSGDAEVYVSTQLDVDINGSGTVRYKGNPQITSHISGSGDLIDAN